MDEPLKKITKLLAISQGQTFFLTSKQEFIDDIYRHNPGITIQEQNEQPSPNFYKNGTHPKVHTEEKIHGLQWASSYIKMDFPDNTGDDSTKWLKYSTKSCISSLSKELICENDS